MRPASARRSGTAKRGIGLSFRHCERSEAIQTRYAAGSLDCFAALAMTILKNRARGPGGTEGRARSQKEEVGGASSFHPASTRKRLTTAEHKQHQAERQQDQP